MPKFSSPNIVELTADAIATKAAKPIKIMPTFPNTASPAVAKTCP
jgi:hypothetical protein